MITARAFRRFLVLPGKPTAFEADYLARVNAIALGFLWLHLPVFIVVAWLNDTRPVLAGVLTSVVLIGPTIAKSALESPRSVSVVHGVAAMFMGGLLVHFGQGPTQIEMHFYFFALLAMCVVFGNPFVILAAAFTVVVHDLVVWTVLPSSVFNYNASFTVVAVHAAFVLLESTAACFIARSFFDNVIGLEKIVGERTRDLRVLLDNVKQGLCTIDASGRMAAQSSAAMDSWFGSSTREDSWFDLLARVDPKFARRSRFAWEEVVADVLPSELTLGQMPSRLLFNGKTLHIDYHCISFATPKRYLLVVTDVTSEVERERQEIESREVMVLFEHALEDATAFDSFFEDGDDCIAMLRRGGAQLSDVRRRIHTLKGNALVFGLESVASFCHVLETVIDERRVAPTAEEYRPLFVRWGNLARDVARIVERRERAVCLDEADFAQLLATAERTSTAMATEVARLRLEPIRHRLRHFSEQALRIGRRLGKDLDVRFEDHGERVDAATFTPLWNAFIHVVRNAVDHGIEDEETRRERGKPLQGSIVLRASHDETTLRIEVADDGGGIDWNALRDRARTKGVVAETDAELKGAIFADGVSTAHGVTEVSGRGVGMGALKQTVAHLGGNVEIVSTPLKGTTVCVVVPYRTEKAPVSVRSSGTRLTEDGFEASRMA